MERCAVFSCLGLGDGLIALVLSNNLHLNGFSVTTFHPFLDAMQGWFPHRIQRFPAIEELDEALKHYDRFFIIYEKTPWMQAILHHCEKHYPEKTRVLNPIATLRCDYPYWEGGRFDGSRPFAENLYLFCKEVLKFPIVTRSNGMDIPDTVARKRFAHRIVLHPTSSRPGKNWPQEKFLKLSEGLKREGFCPVFILTDKEKQEWDLEKIETAPFSSLPELAAYICESAGMIGNCSGIGHLASCLGLKTLTICRSAQAALFWRPAWSEGAIVTPSSLIPNLKGMRWRDHYWKDWITVRKVLKTFLQLA